MHYNTLWTYVTHCKHTHNALEEVMVMDLVMVRVNSKPAYNYIYTAEQAHYNAL